MLAAMESKSEETAIKGKRIGFVGKLGGMSRRELRHFLRQHGSVMVDPPDHSIDWLVIGAEEMTDDIERRVPADLREAVQLGHIRQLSETEFWRESGVPVAESEPGQLYTPAMLAALLGVKISTIRRWHRRGLIQPVTQIHKLPYFDFEEVVSARRIARFITSGASPEAIERKLVELADQFRDVQRPLSQLNVIVQGRNVLLRSGEGLIEPGGQLLFDFESAEDSSEESPSATAILPIEAETDAQSEPPTPEDLLELAIEAEDNGDLETALQMYRAYGLAEGPSPDICFRMGELLYLMGDLSAARERYFMTVEMDDSFVEARASLGCVLVELGEEQLALSAFEGALVHHPDYADVLFHLAGLLDQLDRAEEADVYWRRFLDVASHSPWAQEARTRLGLSVESPDSDETGDRQSDMGDEPENPLIRPLLRPLTPESDDRC